MSVGIYFQFRTAGVIRIPVNPQKLEITQASGNGTENIITIGDVNILRLPRLKEIAFESFIPSEDYGQGYIERNVSILTPIVFVTYFDTVRESKEPLNFVVTGLSFSPMKMAVEDFNYYWDAPDEDLHYSIRLREWKDYGQQILEMPDTSSITVASPAPVTSAGTRENSSKTPTVSSQVVVSGTIYRNAYGGGTVQKDTKATRRVTLINKDGDYPYQISDLTGNILGWINASSFTVL